MKSYLTTTIFMVFYCSCFLFFNSNGQVVYNNLNPDDSISCHSATSLICSDSLNIDINSDGIVDYKFQYSYQQMNIGSGMCVYHKYYRSCLVYPRDLNGIASDSIRPLNLIYASSIDSGLIWTDTSTHASSNSLAYNYTKTIAHCPPASPAVNTITGNWYNHSDEYLGIYIIENGLRHYGWIRLSIISATNIVVKDYAYNFIPDKFILAGDTGNITSGIIYHSVSGPELTVYPNPAKNEITVYSEQSGELQLINNLGQMIYSAQINEGKSQINVSNFSQGIYVVRLCKNQNVMTIRIAIIN